VNFGVFALYNDKALEDALGVGLKLGLALDLSDVMAYPKLSKAYFSFFEVLFRNHLEAVVVLDTPIFLKIVEAQHEGVQSLDAPLAAQCANTIDHLATFLFTHRPSSSPPTTTSRHRTPKPAMQALNQHLQAHPTLLSSLMATLFNQLLFGPMSNQWAVTRPILSLMLCSEQSFTACKEHLISTQSPENQQKLVDAFTKLLADVQRNLENTNRDRFTQRLAAFRLSVRTFLTL